MSFFEPPQLQQQCEARPECRQPPWPGPPDRLVGRPVALDPVLFRGDGVAVVVGGFVAFPTGVELTVRVRARKAEEHLWPFQPERLRRRLHQDEPAELPDDLLRFGVLLADGGKATTLGGHPAWGMDETDEPGDG